MVSDCQGQARRTFFSFTCICSNAGGNVRAHRCRTRARRWIDVQLFGGDCSLRSPPPPAAALGNPSSVLGHYSGLLLQFGVAPCQFTPTINTIFSRRKCRSWMINFWCKNSETQQTSIARSQIINEFPVSQSESISWRLEERRKNILHLQSNTWFSALIFCAKQITNRLLFFATDDLLPSSCPPDFIRCWLMIRSTYSTEGWIGRRPQVTIRFPSLSLNALLPDERQYNTVWTAQYAGLRVPCYSYEFLPLRSCPAKQINGACASTQHRTTASICIGRPTEWSKIQRWLSIFVEMTSFSLKRMLVGNYLTWKGSNSHQACIGILNSTISLLTIPVSEIKAFE